MIFWALSLCDQTWSVHSRIRECGPFHVGISWLCKLGTGRESWSLPTPVGNHYETETTEGFSEADAWGLWGQAFSLSLQSPDLMETCWVQDWGDRYPGLHKIPDPSSYDSGCLDLWVPICSFSKRQWFHKCVAPFPLKWGSFTLSL